MKIPGIAGYAQVAPAMLAANLDFAVVHAPALHLIPTTPCRVLDIGAGPGDEAAALAAMGHRVVAVEPADELRLGAMANHASLSITWLDDGLPDLASVVARGEVFDLVMLTGVWMHQDAEERARAMPVVARLMAPGAVMIMTLRHGPVPPGRRMFEVSGEETIALAQAAGLEMLQNLKTESVQAINRAMGVTWTRLAFRRP